MPSFFSKLLSRKSSPMLDSQAYPTSFMHTAGKPVWMRRDYARFATEAYARNVIAHRSVELVASSVAGVSLKLTEQVDDEKRVIVNHPVLNLLARPNPRQGGSELVQALISHKMISGNGFLHGVGPKGEAPLELHALRPDRVAVVAGEGGVPQGYQYKVGDKMITYPVDRLSGQSRLLHLKHFHPLDDWYGLSPVESAAYSIDQHNQAGAWNQALLQHGARPSGALVVNVKDSGGHLTEDQYYRVKQQIDDQFSGPANAGRPLLLEGGLEWKEMSHSPKDMDFIDAKHSAARDIALAFGVPPQLLGIPGDNTYSNLAEARLALWEQTVLPQLHDLTNALNNWLLPMFGNGLSLSAELDDIPALTPRREKVWDKVKDADFLSDEEKREMVGVKS